MKTTAIKLITFYLIAVVLFVLYFLFAQTSFLVLAFTLMLYRIAIIERAHWKSYLKEQFLLHAVNHDELTGLLNRSGYKILIQNLLDKSLISKTSFALVYVDLDDFKLINDTYGHSIGDQVLIEVAAQLKEVVRHKDLVARLGGDEFVVILVSNKSTMIPNAAESVYTRIASLCSGFNLECVSDKLTASVGVAVYPDDGLDMLNNADQAMYKAKKSGKNKFMFFSENKEVE
jgi:diguanylate cyclase (GGDEF)-like protein